MSTQWCFSRSSCCSSESVPPNAVISGTRSGLRGILSKPASPGLPHHRAEWTCQQRRSQSGCVRTLARVCRRAASGALLARRPLGGSWPLAKERLAARQSEPRPAIHRPEHWQIAASAFYVLPSTNLKETSPGPNRTVGADRADRSDCECPATSGGPLTQWHRSCAAQSAPAPPERASLPSLSRSSHLRAPLRYSTGAREQPVHVDHPGEAEQLTVLHTRHVARHRERHVGQRS